MRLLFFVREPFPTHRVDVDVLFGRELLTRGHKIDFVMQAASQEAPTGLQQWRGQTVSVGATDTRDGFLSRFRKHLLDLLHDLRSLATVPSARYDAVQVRDKFVIAAIAIIVARLRGLKFFYWLSFPHSELQLMCARDGSARYPVFAYLRGVVSGWLLYRWILPRCDHAFVQSEQMRKDIAAHGVSRDKLTAIPMGIAIEDMTAEPLQETSEDRGTSDLTVAYLGIINSQRKLEILVDMLGLLLHQGIIVRLLMIGDGEKPEDRVRIERRARALDVSDHMEITGLLSRAEALNRVRTADIGLSPFYPTPVLLSTSPTKLVEYMALGLPVVANDHPEQRSVLRESRAGLCVPWSARHFARGVTWLATRGPEARRSMGERGRCWVLEHRTYTRIADELEQVYLRVLEVGT